MTLRFLGDTSPQALPDLASALRSSLSGRKELTLRYTALGAFPSLTHPRVIWIGAEEEPELKEIQEIVDRECRRLGLAQADDRRFHPHITLARMKEGRGADILTATVKTLTFEPISDRCAGVQILRSELHPTGSRYTVLEHIPFQPSELEISHG
jgi:2'-5' RNA ligase